jgi:hypothetical protein
MTKQIIVATIPAFMTSLVTVFLAVYTIMHTKKNDSKKEIKKLLDSKVDKEECAKVHSHVQNFKERIGEESDGHRTAIARLEKGMVFLVTKNGGDPSSLMQ